MFAAAVTAVACAVLAGCGMFSKDKAQRRSCPPVLILKDAQDFTKFRDGPGRDITDIEYRVRVANFTGSCVYEEDKVQIDIGVDFALERGPGSQKPEAEFNYFVAIPSFYPRAEGKRVFGAKGAFPESQPRATFHDDLRLTIPIPRNAAPSKYAIYVGLQLTPDQLEFNRARALRR